MEDWELLVAYAHRQDDLAFTTLVERHRDWVYWACVRRLQDVALAEDAAQAVFVILARHAALLARKGTELRLEQWLHKGVRFAVANLRRSEQRRKAREMEAAAMKTEVLESAAAWGEMQGYLEPALDRLAAGDREVILLRYYRHLTHAEIGGRLAITEDAATKRVNRALNKLRHVMTGSGVQASSLVMGSALLEHAVHPVPQAVAAKLALAGTAAGAKGITATVAATAHGASRMMQLAKLKLAAWVAAPLAAAAIIATANLVMAQRGGAPVAHTASTVVFADWIPQLNGCVFEQNSSQIHIFGTTNQDGFGHGNSVASAKSLPKGDFFASVDFMVPQFREGGAAPGGNALVYLRARCATTNVVAILFQPNAGTYQLQGWNPAPVANVFSQPGVRKIGDENTQFHRMKLKYTAATGIASGWIDDQYIGSLTYPLNGDITFELLANTDRQGMDIDLYFDHFSVTTDLSQAPPTAPVTP